MAVADVRADSARANPIVQPVSLGRIYRACREHNLTYTRFGRAAVNDPRLIGDLRNGRELQPRTRQKVHAFIAKLAEGERMSLHQHPAQFAPMPVVAQILAGFERDQLAAFIEVALSLIDASEIDCDLEDDDPDMEEDARFPDQAFTEWHTRGGRKLFGGNYETPSDTGGTGIEDAEDDDPKEDDGQDRCSAGEDDMMGTIDNRPGDTDDCERAYTEWHTRGDVKDDVGGLFCGSLPDEDMEPLIPLLAFDHLAPANQ